jgi:hypothetical protein
MPVGRLKMKRDTLCTGFTHKHNIVCKRNTTNILTIIISYISPDVKDFKETKEYADSVAQFSDWLRDFKGEAKQLYLELKLTNTPGIGVPVKGCNPPIAVIPNTEGNNEPVMPNLPPNPTTEMLQSLVWQYLNVEYSKFHSSFQRFGLTVHKSCRQCGCSPMGENG